MAYSIGYVDNAGTEGVAHWQMLLAIKTLAEANGWTTQRYVNPTDGSNRELILKGVGLSGTEEIYIGFRAYYSVSANYYNVSVAGFTGYVAGNTFESQPGYMESGVPAHNTRIDYWLVVNAQRIAFGLRVGSPSVYETGYVGKMFPFGKPTQFPYPLVVGGMLVGIPATRYSDVSHSMAFKGNRNNMRLRFVSGTWLAPYVWPFGGQSNYADIDANLNLRDTNNIWTLQPLLINDNAANNYGVLDGVYQISGFNNGSENTLTIASNNYVVFGDVWRTGFGDYIAMELT